MKRTIYLLAGVLLLVGLLTGCKTNPAEQTAEPTAEQMVGETTQAGYDGITFSLTGLMGETVDDSIIRGNKLTMVNFWATWCGPCVNEIPDLSKLNDDYADKGFGVIGVLFADTDTDGTKTFLEEKGVSYPVVSVAGVFSDLSANFSAIPTTMFFDVNGEQVGETEVGAKEYDEWAALIDSLLEQAS